MTLKLSLVTAVAGLALLLAAPSLAVVDPGTRADVADKIAMRSAPEQWQQALQARSEALNRKHGLGGSTWTYEQAMTARGRELNRAYGLTIDGAARSPETKQSSAAQAAHDRAIRVNGYEEPTFITPDVFERTVRNGPSSFERTPVFTGDDHVRIDVSDLPVVVPASSPSGTEVEWPQIGIGFGIGILLVLGLALTMRLTRVRQLAH